MKIAYLLCILELVYVAKGFALSNGWNLQPYAEVNAIT